MGASWTNTGLKLSGTRLFKGEREKRNMINYFLVHLSFERAFPKYALSNVLRALTDTHFLNAPLLLFT